MISTWKKTVQYIIILMVIFASSLLMPKNRPAAQETTPQTWYFAIQPDDDSFEIAVFTLDGDIRRFEIEAQLEPSFWQISSQTFVGISDAGIYVATPEQAQLIPDTTEMKLVLASSERYVLAIPEQPHYGELQKAVIIDTQKFTIIPVPSFVEGWTCCTITGDTLHYVGADDSEIFDWKVREFNLLTGEEQILIDREINYGRLKGYTYQPSRDGMRWRWIEIEEGSSSAAFYLREADGTIINMSEHPEFGDPASVVLIDGIIITKPEVCQDECFFTAHSELITSIMPVQDKLVSIYAIWDDLSMLGVHQNSYWFYTASEPLYLGEAFLTVSYIGTRRYARQWLWVYQIRDETEVGVLWNLETRTIVAEFPLIDSMSFAAGVVTLDTGLLVTVMERTEDDRLTHYYFIDGLNGEIIDLSTPKTMKGRYFAQDETGAFFFANSFAEGGQGIYRMINGEYEMFLEGAWLVSTYPPAP